MQSIKTECLKKMVFFETRSLDKAIRNFVRHYNSERKDQGIGNELIDTEELLREEKVVRDKRLGGLLIFYRRTA